MNNFPRKPVRFIDHNVELLKSTASSGGQAGATDYVNTEDAVDAKMGPTYRAPSEREDGNVLFRRFPSGELDLEAAKHIVVDILHKIKDKGPLNNLEELAASCVFPMMFSYVDSRVATPLMAVQLKLAPWECAMIAELVIAHLRMEMSPDGRFPTDHPRS